MSPSSTGHQIPPAPTRIRKRKSPPQPRSGVISARQPVPAEASRPVPAAPAPKPVRKRTNVADLVKRIQDMEDALAQVVCDHEARLDALEIKMTGLINRVHASTDSVTLDDMTGVCRRLDALEAAAEVARVVAQPHPVLIQAKAPTAPLESNKPKEHTMQPTTKETAVPSAVKAYANHLIWAAVIIASLIIWAVATRSKDDAPVPAPVVAAAETTWVYDVPVPKMQPDTMVRRKMGRMFDLGLRFGYDSGWHAGIAHVRDSLSRLPKPRKATMADFVETDAERARRLDSAAKAAKDPLGLF